MRASVQKQDRRSSAHDALCALVLQAKEPFVKLFEPKIVVHTREHEHGSHGSAEYIYNKDKVFYGDMEFKKPIGWKWDEKTPFLFTETEYLNSENIITAVCEEKLGNIFADIVFRVNTIANMRTEALVAVSGKQECDEVKWKWQEIFRWILLVEVKSENEVYSAGDVIRQLKTYESYLQREPFFYLGRVCVHQQILDSSSEELFANEGVVPISEDILHGLLRGDGDDLSLAGFHPEILVNR